MKTDLSKLRVGVIHSIIGKNDGVSIVIDDTIQAMMSEMNIPLGNFHFLAAHSPPRFQVTTDEVFWHKNDINRAAVKHFSGEPPPNLESRIRSYARYAQKIIRDFVASNHIDLIIAHNTSHIYNFITAVALGEYIEERRQKGLKNPRIVVWWHDSHFERAGYDNPNKIIGKYLKYLPGTCVDGIVFINTAQPDIAKRYFKFHKARGIEKFFAERTRIIPNTCDIPWDWKKQHWRSNKLIFPPQAQYNRSFLKDIGLVKELEKRHLSVGDAVILLQHTRIVPRKKIETAVDFAFKLEQRYQRERRDKCVALLVSGHSGDEQNAYKRRLRRHFNQMARRNPDAKVMMMFAEDRVLPARELIVDRKYYRFHDVPSIVASMGGIGVYFSEVEGFGNNLLEMIRFALPVVVNKYDIYKRDIEKLGFDLPAVENNQLTDDVVDRAYELLTNYRKRNALVKRNLDALSRKLNPSLITDNLAPLIEMIYDPDVIKRASPAIPEVRGRRSEVRKQMTDK